MHPFVITPKPSTLFVCRRTNNKIRFNRFWIMCGVLDQIMSRNQATHHSHFSPPIEAPKTMLALLMSLLVVHANAQPAVLATPSLVAQNCRFDSDGAGCSYGYLQTWAEAKQLDPKSPRINILKRNTTTLPTPCDLSSTVVNQCGAHGTCSLTTSSCICDDYYIHELINYTGIFNDNNHTIVVDPCHYQATSKKLIFFLSLFFGLCGFDWCWLGLAVNTSYICLGCFKFLTLGGVGVWWVYDIVVLYMYQGPCDGWGMELWDDLTGTGSPTGLTTGL